MVSYISVLVQCLYSSASTLNKVGQGKMLSDNLHDNTARAKVRPTCSFVSMLKLSTL